MGLMSTVASRAVKGGMNPLKFNRLLRKRHRDPSYVGVLLKRALSKGHGALVGRILRRADLPLTPRDRAALSL